MLLTWFGVLVRRRAHRIGLAIARAVVCLSLGAMSGGNGAFAVELDRRAYGIMADPKAGPVGSFQPVKALASIPFQLPFDWDTDPYGDRNWRFNLHTLRIVDPALAARDFDYARAIFLDWARWHKSCWLANLWCAERATDFSWNDMATGIRASRLAYLMRATGWKDKELIELAERHAVTLHDTEFIAKTNHAVFQLHGLAALCIDRKLRACDGVEGFIEQELDAVLRDQFAQSGMHRENSPGYHFFIARVLADVAPLLESFAPELVTLVEQAERNQPWLVHPDRTIVLLGDSAASPRKTLVFPDGTPDCESIGSYREATDCYMIKRFPDVGYVIIRSDWAIPAIGASTLFVQGGFFEQTHRDADDFSFEWFERGRKILSDSGKYGYTRDEWHEYFNSTRAHNTVEVDGKDYTQRQDLAYGDAVQLVEQTSESVKIVMEVEHIEQETWHRREIRYSPGEQLVVEDTLRSDKKRRYIQWHHFTRDFDLLGDAGRFKADDGEMAVELEVFSSCGERTSYEMIKGEISPRIQGWASLANRERHPRWALGVVCEAETASFSARFRLPSVGG